MGNTANAGTQGTWQYSTNGGTNWFAIGTVADDATALAISSSTLIRFVPVADYNGTPPALVVRGLDNTYAAGFSTTAGSETRVNVNTTTNGGTTAIAAATANLSTSITAVNDAPVRTAGTRDQPDGSGGFRPDQSGLWRRDLQPRRRRRRERADADLHGHGHPRSLGNVYLADGTTLVG